MNNSMSEFFNFYKIKCVKGSAISKHKLDTGRKCMRCGFVSGGDWKRSPNGILYYNTYKEQYEKAYMNKMIMGILNIITGENIKICPIDCS